jgi:hypothetical protein
MWKTPFGPVFTRFFSPQAGVEKEFVLQHPLWGVKRAVFIHRNFFHIQQPLWKISYERNAEYLISRI